MARLSFVRLLECLALLGAAGYVFWTVFNDGAPPVSFAQLGFAAAAVVAGELAARLLCRFTTVTVILACLGAAALAFQQQLAAYTGVDLTPVRTAIDPLTLPFSIGFVFGFVAFILTLSERRLRGQLASANSVTGLQSAFRNMPVLSEPAEAVPPEYVRTRSNAGAERPVQPEPSDAVAPAGEAAAAADTAVVTAPTATSSSAASPAASTASGATPSAKNDAAVDLALENVSDVVRTARVAIVFGQTGDKGYFVVTSDGLSIAQLDREDGLFKKVQTVSGVVYATEAKARNLGNGRKQMTLRLEGDREAAAAGLKAVIESDARFN